MKKWVKKCKAVLSFHGICKGNQSPLEEMDEIY